MPSRRRLLAGVSGVASLGIAGCTGDTGNGGNGGSETDTPDSETDTPEPETEEPETDTPESETDTPEPAEFEFINIEPDGETVNYGDEIEVEVTVENTGGESGSQNIEYYINNELTDNLEVSLDATEETSLTVGIITDLYSEGELEYSFTSEDDEISASVDVTIDQPSTQSFSGSGQSVEEGIEIDGGLTVVDASHNGESNFQVSLVNDSQFDDNFINVIGEFDGAQADLIDEGEYLLDINADGSWDIDIEQPRAGSGDSLPESISGNGPDVVGPIEFNGTHIADGSHSGESNFQVQVYPMEGSFAETLFNEIGEFDGETTFSYSGVGWVDINADGSWQIDIE